MGWRARISPDSSWLREYVATVEQLDGAMHAALQPMPVPFTRFALDHPLWNYPLLFKDSFPEVAPVDCGRLAAAARWLSSGILYTDAVIDGQRAISAELALHEEIARRAHRLLAKLLDDSSAFWTDVDRYGREWAAAQHMEQRIRCGEIGWDALSDEDHRAMSAGRSALGKLVPAAMASLSGRRAELGAFERSYDLYNVSHQLYDDLLDWRADVVGQRLSWVLWRLWRRHPEPSEWSVAATRARIHANGFSLAQLGEALSLLEEAREAVRGSKAEDWLGFLEFESGRTRALRRDLARIVLRGVEA